MDRTTFEIFVIMLIGMAMASYLIPRAAKGVSRTAIIAGFVPSLCLMAIAQTDVAVEPAFDPFALGLIAMFVGPLVAVFVAIVISRRTSDRGGKRP